MVLNLICVAWRFSGYDRRSTTQRACSVYLTARIPVDCKVAGSTNLTQCPCFRSRPVISETCYTIFPFSLILSPTACQGSRRVGAESGTPRRYSTGARCVPDSRYRLEKRVVRVRADKHIAEAVPIRPTLTRGNIRR